MLIEKKLFIAVVTLKLNSSLGVGFESHDCLDDPWKYGAKTSEPSFEIQSAWY